MATVYGGQCPFDSGRGWWRTKVDYSGSSATVTLEVKSGYTVFVKITGKVNGTANSTLTYNSSATSTKTLGTVSINQNSSNTIALTCTGGTWGQNGTSTATIPAQVQTGSFNMNILNPDGSEPYSTGEAGSVERSINGGTYERKYNEDANSYAVGTTFSYRNFIPGAHRYLASVSGLSPNNTTGPWTATQSSSGTVVDFKTAWNSYGLTIWPGSGTYNGSASNQTITQQYGTTASIGFPTPPTGHVFAGYSCPGSLSGIHTRDAIFESGNGDLSVYNNSGNGLVTFTRMQDDSVPNRSMGSSSVGYCIRIDKAAGTVSPYCGGLINYTQSVANRVYRHIVWAKIPVGYTIGHYRNAIGDGGWSEWLTDTQGTGDWYQYVYDTHCGSGGSFSSFGHVAINANNGDNNAAVTWYVCASQVTDITGNLTYTFDGSSSVECFYAPKALTMSYNADGGSETPASALLTYGQTYTLSSTVPTKELHNFLGWSCNGTTYQPGQTITPSANMTFVAVWSQPTVTTSTATTYIANILRGGMYYYVKFVPDVSGTYVFEGVSSTASSGDTYGYLYDSTGTQLKSNDDSGDGTHFLIYQEDLTAGSTYYIGVRYYSSSYTGDIGVRVAITYPIRKFTSSTNSWTNTYKIHGKSLDLGTATKSATTLATWKVNFDGNGGTVSSSYASPAFKQYYKFVNWYTAANGGGTAVGTTYTTDAPLDAYAHFVEDYRQANTVTLPTATWDDHILLGWDINKLNITGARSMTSFRPTSNNMTIYAIWYVPKCYVKTESGWKSGHVLLKTDEGWKPNELLHIKTDSGWKTGAIYTQGQTKVVQGPFVGPLSMNFRACYNNRPRFDWGARMCYQQSTTSTDSILCGFLPPAGSEQYGYRLMLNRSTGVLTMLNGSYTVTYSLSSAGVKPGDFFDIRFVADYYSGGSSSSYYVNLYINGAKVSQISANYYYSSNMSATFGNSGMYFTSMNYRTNYSSGSFDIGDYNIGDSVSIGTATNSNTTSTIITEVLL